MRELGNRAKGAESAATAPGNGILTRRNVLGVCVGIGGGPAFLAGGLAYQLIRKQRAARDALDTFGTIDNPVYKVDTSLPFSTLQTFNARTRAFGGVITPQIIEKSDAAMRMLSDQLDQEIRQFRGAIKSPAITQAAKVMAHERFFKVVSWIDSNLREVLKPFKAYMGTVEQAQVRDARDGLQLEKVHLASIEKSFKEKVETLGSPESFVKELVKKLTGKDLPEWARLEVRPIDQDGILGFANFTTREIVAKDRVYEGVVIAFAHEVGHIISMHEEAFEAGRGPRVPTAKDVDAWEEACAHAFEATVASYLGSSHTEEGRLAHDLFLRDYRIFTENYYGGVNVTECHHVGMVYLDAALTVLGSPGAAYNYLSSHTELSPAMLAVIEENKFRVQQGVVDGELLVQRLLALQERVEKALEACRVPG